MDVNQAAAAEARKQKIRNLEFSLFGEKQNDVSFFFLQTFSFYNIDKVISALHLIVEKRVLSH